MTIKELNQKFIETYLNTSLGLRAKSSYPFLIDFQSSPDVNNVPIYFKQPQDWLSSHYGKMLDSDILYNLLMTEYNHNLLLNTNYAPIKYFLYCRDRIHGEHQNINLIYNNIIKFSRISNPDYYDGDLSNIFNDLLGEEYKIIKPIRSVFCVGQSESDYSDMMSWKMLNNINISPLTIEKPYNIYVDFLGNEVLHTYHPGYWFDISIDLEDIVYRFIVGGAVNI